MVYLYPPHKQRVAHHPLGLPVAYMASTFCTNQKPQVMAGLLVCVKMFWTKAINWPKTRGHLQEDEVSTKFRLLCSCYLGDPIPFLSPGIYHYCNGILTPILKPMETKLPLEQGRRLGCPMLLQYSRCLRTGMATGQLISLLLCSTVSAPCSGVVLSAPNSKSLL